MNLIDTSVQLLQDILSHCQAKHLAALEATCKNYFCGHRIDGHKTDEAAIKKLALMPGAEHLTLGYSF